ncbi:cell division protein FtsL [Desulfotomaculum copahuensis]|uniref:Cell division protein FtsL n=1 Tax=Desulfotomaculum copahuensis TaxID=1838280 RepID=A0A1B7LEU5_9FIRM|nr:cell division protein FtsL [Desulfotomaculum copahuensis]OAT81815.1 hypothetical protein A6M21_10500 [Desulfotomaculum copahuensis]
MIVAREQPYHQSPPGEKRRPVPDPRPNTLPRRRQLALTGLVLLAFLTGIAVCYLHAQIMTTGCQIVSLQKNLGDLNVETRELSEQVAGLSSLQRIEQVATTRLGMVKPDNKNVVLVQATPQPSGSAAAAPSRTKPAGVVRVPAAKDRNWVLQALAELVGHREGRTRPG